MARTGRPSSAVHAVVTVRHRDTGHAVAWSDGTFGGDPELVSAARAIAAAPDRVLLGSRAYEMDGTPAAAAAAMLAAACGRGVLVSDLSILGH